jgi:hypothetical protein
MNPQNDKYNILITKLKATNPSISDPEMLTDSIMNSIHPLKYKENGIIVFLRTFSSAAAVLLIGLFLYQINEPVTNLNVGEKSRLMNITVQKTEYCDNEQNNGKQDQKQQLKRYLCYLNRNTRENKASKDVFTKFNRNAN